ncbi:hypothetical protein U1Q18_049653 [Sarracenia purpurea var. burkii]
MRSRPIREIRLGKPNPTTGYLTTWAQNIVRCASPRILRISTRLTPPTSTVSTASSSWGSYLGHKSNVRVSNTTTHRRDSDLRWELLYLSLHLLTLGYINGNIGCYTPSISSENAFLNRVVEPIYETIDAKWDCSTLGVGELI